MDTLNTLLTSASILQNPDFYRTFYLKFRCYLELQEFEVVTSIVDCSTMASASAKYFWQVSSLES